MQRAETFPYRVSHSTSIPQALRKVNTRFQKDDEQAIKSFIQRSPSYLEAPLIRASNATRRSNSNRYKSFMKNVLTAFKNPKRWYDEFVENLTSEERE